MRGFEKASHGLAGFENWVMIIGMGIASFLITLQALFNIAVVSGAIPNKGLSLPFISYGGSNLLMLLISAGALLRVARAAVEPAREESAVAAFTNLPLSRLA